MGRHHHHDESSNDITKDDEDDSLSSDEEDRNRSKKHHRKKERDRERSHHRSKRKSSSPSRKEKRKEHHKKKQKKKKRKHKDDDYDSTSNDSDEDGNDEVDSSGGRRSRSKREKRDGSKNDRKSHRRKKSSKKEKSRKKRKADKSLSSDSDSSESSGTKDGGKHNTPEAELARNYALADALHSLLRNYPAFASDLPILLIRLVNGTSFDLRQMTDVTAKDGLQRVLQCLKPFGIIENDDQEIVWQQQQPRKLGGGGQRPATDERILLRVIRALLNEIGITSDAVQNYSSRPTNKTTTTKYEGEDNVGDGSDADDPHINIKKQTFDLLDKFDKENKESGDDDTANKDDSKEQPSLKKELGDICKMVLQGESIALDGLPDAKLRSALESLFVLCGLEKSEIEDDDDDDDDDDDEDSKEGAKEKEPIMGYGLPEERDEGDGLIKEMARERILVVMETCVASLQKKKAPVARVVKGPQLPNSKFANRGAIDSSSDEEGPALVSDIAVATKRRPNSLPLSEEEVREAAKQRALDFEDVVSGGAGSASRMAKRSGPGVSDGKREEWMLVPGKFDLLSSIKSGEAIRSRTFAGKSKIKRNENEDSRPVDPAIQKEMDEIMQAHADSRGLSLMEQHRLKKEQVKADARNKSKKQEWNWNRDKDLDSGRRVDKDALRMVLGGANTELKNKFQGGFSR